MTRILAVLLAALVCGAYWGTSAHAKAKPAPKPHPINGCAFAVGDLAYVFVDMPGAGKVAYIVAGPQLVQAVKVPAAQWPCGPDDPRAA